VSLDAFRDVNDELRGKGSYDKVIAGFKAINREKEKRKAKYPMLGVVTVVTNKNYMDLANLAEATKEYNLDLHIYNLGTYTNDNIVAEQKRFMKEKLDTEIDCLEAYNTGYNLGIDGQKLHKILHDIQEKNYGHPILTVPALNPEKTHTYYAELETPVRNHCIVPWCQLNVNYNGDVHFCADYTDYILGNITQQSIKEIYNGDRANLFRKTLHECKGGMFPGCLRCYQNMLFGKKIKGF
jgi:radical SAM protein with 4Fe4S-binding SPASM domain